MLQVASTCLGAAPRPAAGPAALRPRAQPSHVCHANYRWSASSEDSGRRKREWLYGYDGNGEPLAGSSATTADGSNGAAPNEEWQGDWQQWQQGGDAQPPSAAAWDAQQQQAWDAAAALDASPRRRRRERSWDAAATGEARTSRLSQRRQQRVEQQQAEEQQWLAEQEQQEQQQRAQRQGASQEGDPWVEAELRQLRGRQGARAGSAAAGAAAAAAAGAGKLPDPWAQEWGPLQGARAAAAAQDWGWGAESWAGGGGGSAVRRQRREEAAAADAAPGSSWDLRQQQRELRRRRRRAAGGDDEDEEAAAERASRQQVACAAAANGAQPRYGVDYDAELEGLGLEGEEYLEDNWGEEVPPGSAGWRARAHADGGTFAGQDGGEYSRQYEAGLMTEPDIALLSEDELERVLPVVPSSQQAAFFSGSATDGVQRWGASLALTVLFSKVALLAATSLSWPLWWPWALAARKNIAVRRQLRHGGLWRTQVLEVTTTGRPRPFSSTDEGGLLGSTMRMARVLVGDPGGAQAEMRLPYDSRYELIRAGEPAELVVLCNDTSFQAFKAVKDAYLPDSGLWVSEYPHCDRTQFLEVSLQVEREAQEALNAQQWQQQEQQREGAAAAAQQQSYSGSESDQGFYRPAGGWSQDEDYGSSGRY
ncbi:phosphate ABC transporter permease [Chlorella sorokiniana]|uniref:Phosphate ABC transporter permease n=1 Tax=Chlorella sorokiniana TaxID=3076 RepID=A0A2P6TWG2_CHLSO|nr:phosphate ABC transporter permease [Chlorella sorokiniana]|eukprot:PRW58401.1 phosphate ABC transporter permease [Chlorella sorokiniana]